MNSTITLEIYVKAIFTNDESDNTHCRLQCKKLNMNIKQHKNSQKRIYGNFTYFITCNIEGNLCFFKEPLFCKLWIKQLELCKSLLNFKLYAFCLNYDHFHIMIQPDDKTANYSRIMQFLKRNYSKNINFVLGFHKKTTESDNAHCRFQYQKHNHLKPWQITLDRYVVDLQKRFYLVYGGNHKYPKLKWQKSFYDHIIRDQNDFNHHWNYTMNNYKKHNLPEDWKYTGIHYSELIDEI